MTGAAKTGNKLVHDANPRADKYVFRSLAQLRDLRQCKPGAVEAHEGERAGHFNRGRGTEAGADGHFTPDQQAGARSRMPDLSQHHRNTKNIV